jgi:thiamine pyrophosphokinase
MRVLIVSNGSDVDPEFLRPLQAEHDLTVVTDGAVHCLRGVVPDVVCGDFDSIDRERAEATYPNALYVHLPDQNSCDLEKAIVFALERGASSITLVGVFGGRIDFSFATLSVLLRYYTEVPLCVLHERSSVWVLGDGSQYNNPLSFAARAGDTVSILPIAQASRVTVKNVEWPLDSETMTPGSRGVSNKALGGLVEVEVSEGPVVVCWLPKT